MAGEGNRFRKSPTRKLKEMMTAVMIERRYTKREILEMYLNTVEFGNNSSGIQAASRAFFSKNAVDLTVPEAATLVGMLKAPTAYNPIRNPQNAQRRRNIVMAQMLRNGALTRADFDRYKDAAVQTTPSSSELVESIAPYFAMHVRDWLRNWGRETGHDIYKEGLIVTTTLDSRMQAEAERAVKAQMTGMQAVVDYEWGKGGSLGSSPDAYVRAMNAPDAPAPFARLWEDSTRLVNEYVTKTPRFAALVRGVEAADDVPARAAVSPEEALRTLRADAPFMDSLRYARTRLEAAFIAVDPHTGQVRAWVGGRTIEGEGTRSANARAADPLASVGPRGAFDRPDASAPARIVPDWYDHVFTAKRQPGSTFKPFVYLTAIDNGYGPDMSIGGGPFTWRGSGPCAGQSWSPRGGGGNKTLRRALATSDNYVTARLMTRLNPRVVALYAQRMGITSALIPAGVRAECYMSLALGTSDVSLYELSSAYATLANGGLYNPPYGGDAHRGPQGQHPLPGHARAPRGGVGGDGLHGRGHDARGPGLRHGPGPAAPLRPARVRLRRQDGHHAAERRRLADGDAPGPRGGGVGGLQRPPHLVPLRLLGAGRAQRALPRRRLPAPPQGQRRNRPRPRGHVPGSGFRGHDGVHPGRRRARGHPRRSARPRAPRALVRQHASPRRRAVPPGVVRSGPWGPGRER